MATHLYLPVTLQRTIYILFLCTLLQQSAIAYAESAFGVLAEAAPLNIEMKNRPPRICKSQEVNKLSDFRSLLNCTRVLGHLRIAYLPSTITGNETPSIQTAVEEITDYLLVYRSDGLQSLERLFPKLKIIRGRELLFNEFALVIYENRELNNLGLGSLLRIQRGNIRIENNPSLCYIDTVNWVQLLGNSTQQHFYHKRNRPNNHCTLCPRTGNDIVVQVEVPTKLRSHCWSLNLEQRRPTTSSLANCSSDCGIRGCDDLGVCCDHNCLSGCNGMHCDFCANLNLDGICVDECPESYVVFQKSQCITSVKCRSRGGIPHAGVCVETCPQYHYASFNKLAELSCLLNCTGNFLIHTEKDIEALAGCMTINGSLTFELTDIKVKITELEYAFRNLTEITGYLKVVKSAQLLSLHFLPNLLSICGQQLVDDLYALYVVDNYHLSDIWTPNQKVAIRNGSIYFHLNPRLCLDKILALKDSIKDGKTLNNINISPHSNGERVICNSYVKELNTTVEDYNSTAACIKLDVFTTNNIHIILGYIYFIKPAPIKNVSLFDGRHGCGHDHWRMELHASQNIRYIITRLKPNTQYAYFVKTLTITDYHIRADAYSKIQYFRTLPTKPGPVRRIYYTPISADTLMLHWWPPRKANGEIEKYIIRYEKVDLGKNTTLSDHPKVVETTIECDCEVENTEESGPLPADENYYNRAKLIYEESLPNLIYAKSGDRRRIGRDVRSIDCGRNANCAGKLPTTPNNINAFLDTTTKHLRKRREIIDTENKSLTEDEKKRKKKWKKIREGKDETDEDEDEGGNSQTEDERKRNKKWKKIHEGKEETDEDEDEGENEDDDDHKLEGDLNLMQAIRNYNLYLQQQEEKAYRAQDTGPDDYRILKPRPVCPLPDVSVQYQLQNGCQQMETYPGIVVQGHVHSYKLSGLERNEGYRISVRACVADLKNACGPETTINAETMSMQQYILNTPYTY